MIDPLNPSALQHAIAAYMNVPVETITLEFQTGPLRKAVARSIRAYLAHVRAPAGRLRLLAPPSPAPDPETPSSDLPTGFSEAAE